MKHRIYITVFALLLAYSTLLHSQEQLNVIIVMDSSGSMAARMENKTKMDVAKEVLSNLVSQLPPNAQTGLRAYGHRSKKDCQDTELLVPVAPLQPDFFRQTVQTLRPLGQTPISYSLIQAADDLKDKNGKKVVILISDGEETCGGDPCATATAFKEKGIDLQIHVVGFDIDTQKARKQLTCIAQATGGSYFDAKNSSQLLGSLQTAVETSSCGGGNNLIVNPDAEAAPASKDGTVVAVPGWTTNGEFTTIEYGGRSDVLHLDTPGPQNRGKNFFVGGNSESSSASQSIDVADKASEIDSGRANFTFCGWLGGFASQNDRVVVTANFIDASGKPLDSISIGPVTNTDRGNLDKLMLRSTSGKVPAGSRRVQIVIQMMRAEGTLDDAYADNLSFTLSTQ
jgi:von Willebrand factor type A domain